MNFTPDLASLTRLKQEFNSSCTFGLARTPFQQEFNNDGPPASFEERVEQLCRKLFAYMDHVRPEVGDDLTDAEIAAWVEAHRWEVEAEVLAPERARIRAGRPR